MHEQQFWRGILILLNNYHALNKKIFECLITKVEKIRRSTPQAQEDPLTDLDESAECVGDITLTELQCELRKSSHRIANDYDGYRITLKLLTKKLEHENIIAVAIIDFAKCIYFCRFQSKHCDDFLVRLDGEELVVNILSNRISVEHSEHWAEYVLKAKLLKWCQSTPRHDSEADGEEQPEKQNCDEKLGATAVVKSLQLVDKEQYNNLYKQLKQKHAQHVLQFWEAARESTDPLKFIYEDLAIAAYLISLWRCSASEPRAFADLGCGNGLLVYILNAEGYAGYGYDIRARKLWAHYPTAIQLIEQPIVPDNFQLPSDVDWLIGNHSDELSPWLPLLAATASYDMRYFLLPCCAYEFSGAKFQRRNTGISTYQDFLHYTLQISEECGFETQRDRLKIPSTKRLALVGLGRKYGSGEHAIRCQALKAYVSAERTRYPVPTTNAESTMTTTAVKLREKTETVRNCTKLDKQVLDSLVLKIFNLLLACSEQANAATNNASDYSWKSGGQLSMRQIVASLTREELTHIKSECGGIKTLLRNRHEIFEFCGGDQIGIRRPKPRTTPPAHKSQTIKKRLCFFKQHHPQGCPLTDAECTFLH